MKKDSRAYIMEFDDLELAVDFGKKESNDYAVEVISQNKNGKVGVISVKDLGRAYKWDDTDIKSYIANMKSAGYDVILDYAHNV